MQHICEDWDDDDIIQNEMCRSSIIVDPSSDEEYKPRTAAKSKLKLKRSKKQPNAEHPVCKPAKASPAPPKPHAENEAPPDATPVGPKNAESALPNLPALPVSPPGHPPDGENPQASSPKLHLHLPPDDADADDENEVVSSQSCDNKEEEQDFIFDRGNQEHFKNRVKGVNDKRSVEIDLIITWHQSDPKKRVWPANCGRKKKNSFRKMAIEYTYDPTEKTLRHTLTNSDTIGEYISNSNLGLPIIFIQLHSRFAEIIN
jgi:hypothetical protein